MGLRHGFGLFLEPMSSDFGWGRGIFAFALAVQNLIWGLSQPFTGALADRFGAAKIIVAGGILYVLGLCFMSLSSSALGMTVSAGLLIGFGLSGTTFSVILGAVSRAVPAEKRSMAMGIVVRRARLVNLPCCPARWDDQWLGWSSALLAMGRCRTHDRWAPCSGPAQPQGSGDLSLRDALNERRGKRIATGSAFSSAASMVFIAVHLPGYLFDNGLAVQVGTTVLALVGLFNIVQLAGWEVSGRNRAYSALPHPGRDHHGFYRPALIASAYLFGIAAAVILHRSAHQRHCRIGVWRSPSLDVGWYRVSLSSAQLFMGVWLGGFLYDHTGTTIRVADCHRAVRGRCRAPLVHQ